MKNSNRTALSAALLAATEDLAIQLLASEPFTAYHAARGRLNADAGARALLQRLSQAQAELRQKQAHEAVAQSDVDQVRALQSAVQADQTIADYLHTQQAAVGILREMNREISELLGVDFAALAKHLLMGHGFHYVRSCNEHVRSVLNHHDEVGDSG